MTASNLDFASSFRRRFATWDRTVWSVTSSYARHHLASMSLTAPTQPHSIKFSPYLHSGVG